jgi:hypothetical protein
VLCVHKEAHVEETRKHILSQTRDGKLTLETNTLLKQHVLETITRMMLEIPFVEMLTTGIS